jgi:hypothetical protein
VAGPAPDQLLAVRRRRPGHAPHRGPPGRSRETPPALAQASLSAMLRGHLFLRVGERLVERRIGVGS